jgi:hypothetical protein
LWGFFQAIGTNSSGLVKTLRTLVLSGYTPDYEISGVADPFLQVGVIAWPSFGIIRW